MERNSGSPTKPTGDSHRMQCMELWGGSAETDTLVTMSGLTGYLYSRPYGHGRHGGDVYYFSSCASGRISRVLLADVTGHGAAVAGTATTLRDVMRRNVNVIRQARLMDEINREFGQLSSDGGFATALAATYFSPTGTMTISLAGHPPPFFYCKSTGAWTLFGIDRKGAGGPNLPLGVLDETKYDSVSIEMGADDLLLAYTDAFVESVGVDGELLRVQGLLELVRQAPMERPSAIVPWLISRLRDFRETNLTLDDATLLLLQPTGRRIPMRDNLLAPFRILRGVIQADAPAQS